MEFDPDGQLSDPGLTEHIGRYRIVRRLGQGAMGRVLLAHDPAFDRRVAIKLLRDDLKLPPEQRQALLDRMRHEARASARISHPNIVALHDMGETKNLDLFLVFEYAEGVTLKDKLLEGPVGRLQGARLSREIGGALTALHDAGVLHRDIKPENIILTKNGSKIADFGIARVPDSTLTRDGGLLGTPAYSSPESISEGVFSPQSDQFSMATTLYEALSGQRAFPGEDAVAVATRITTEQPPPIARLVGLDAEVDHVLERAMHKDPSQRFHSAAAFGEALAKTLEHEPRPALQTLPDAFHAQLAQTPPPEPHHARFALGGAVAGVCLTIIGFEIVTHTKPEPPPPPEVIAEPDPLPSVTKPAVGFLAEPLPKPKQKNSTAKRRAALSKEKDAGLGSADAHSPFDAGVESRADGWAGKTQAPKRLPTRDKP